MDVDNDNGERSCEINDYDNVGEPLTRSIRRHHSEDILTSFQYSRDREENAYGYSEVLPNVEGVHDRRAYQTSENSRVQQQESIRYDEANNSFTISIGLPEVRKDVLLEHFESSLSYGNGFQNLSSNNHQTKDSVTNNGLSSQQKSVTYGKLKRTTAVVLCERSTNQEVENYEIIVEEDESNMEFSNKAEYSPPEIYFDRIQMPQSQPGSSSAIVGDIKNEVEVGRPYNVDDPSTEAYFQSQHRIKRQKLNDYVTKLKDVKNELEAIRPYVAQDPLTEHSDRKYSKLQQQEDAENGMKVLHYYKTETSTGTDFNINSQDDLNRSPKRRVMSKTSLCDTISESLACTERLFSISFFTRDVYVRVSDLATEVAFIFKELSKDCPVLSDTFYQLASRSLTLSAMALNSIPAARKLMDDIVEESISFMAMIPSVLDLLHTVQSMIHFCQDLIIDCQKINAKCFSFPENTDLERTIRQKIETVLKLLFKVEQKLKACAVEFEKASSDLENKSPENRIIRSLTPDPTWLTCFVCSRFSDSGSMSALYRRFSSSFNRVRRLFTCGSSE
ncbi:uncharacterized protein [Periplaneta americana]|uniref:uncharacterized protein n=1 Tax=Periplaneta americana TaxID=6978 RepID=UPI0037E97F95